MILPSLQINCHLPTLVNYQYIPKKPLVYIPGSTPTEFHSIGQNLVAEREYLQFLIRWCGPCTYTNSSSIHWCMSWIYTDEFTILNLPTNSNTYPIRFMFLDLPTDSNTYTVWFTFADLPTDSNIFQHIYISKLPTDLYF